MIEEPVVTRDPEPCPLALRLLDADELCGKCGWRAAAHRNHHAYPRLPEKDIHEEAIDTFGIDQRIDKAIEELFELGAALAQFKGGRATSRQVATEIADVRITCVSLERIFGVELVEQEHGRKLAWLRECITKERTKREDEEAASRLEVPGV